MKNRFDTIKPARTNNTYRAILYFSNIVVRYRSGATLKDKLNASGSCRNLAI